MFKAHGHLTMYYTVCNIKMHLYLFILRQKLLHFKIMADKYMAHKSDHSPKILTLETSIGMTKTIMNGKYQETNVVSVTRMWCFRQLP